MNAPENQKILQDLYNNFNVVNIEDKIKILDQIAGGQSNFHGFGGNGVVSETQKLRILEQEYLENRGLIHVNYY